MTDIRLRVTQKQPIRLRVMPALIPTNAAATAGTVTTLAPGSPATVVNVGTPQNPVLNFGIPQGVPGAVQSINGISDINVILAAESIPVTPAGGISSTTAQDAINELDTEKLAKASNLGDVSDAAAARENIVVPTYVATRTALDALDPTKDTLAQLTELSYEGLYKWNGADLSATMVLASGTTTAVNSGTETATLTAHGLATGNGVIVTAAVDGLSINTVYWAIKVDANNFKLAASRANALAGTAFNLTGTTNFTFKRLLDPDLVRYRGKTTALDGSTGAWVLSKSDPTGGFYETDVSRARIQRFADRIMIGDATAYNGGVFGAGGDGSWLFSQGAGTTMGWLEAGAVVASVTKRGIALMGSSKNDNGLVSIGVSGWAMHNISNAGGRAWGGYFEGVLNDASGGRAKGIEVDATNLVNHNVTHTPYTVGDLMAVWIACGGDGTVNTTSYPADTAIGIGPNGNTFNAGIVFQDGGLTRDGGTSGRAHAIRMSYDQAIEWYEFTTSSLALSIVSQIPDVSGKQELRFTNAGMSLLDTAGKTQFQAQRVASAVNYISAVPAVAGGAVAISALGDDTNINLTLRSKGSGVISLTTGNGLAAQFSANASAVNSVLVSATATGTSPLLSTAGSDTDLDMRMRGKGAGGVDLQDGGSASKFKVNTTGIGFFATTPVAAKTGWGVPTGTFTRTTFVTGSVTLPNLAAAVAALIQDLHQTAGYGLLRT